MESDEEESVSGDELPNDSSEDENDEEYQDSSDEDQKGGADIKIIKIDESMLLNKDFK